MFQPSQLILARKARGLTRQVLADRIRISSRTLARWEKGDAEPPSEAVVDIAATLGFPREFFSREWMPDLPDGAISFRAASKMSAREREASRLFAHNAIVLARELESRYRLPSSDLPTLPGYDPEVAAETVRARWGCTAPRIENVTDLLEAHGVRVFSLPEDVSSVDAFSFHYEGRPIILSATWKSAERRRFDLAHELAHLILHCEAESPVGRVAEAQANTFASALLMPRTDVLTAPLRGASMQVVLRWRARWGVSAMALVRRLRDLGMLTEWGYRDLCVTLSEHGFRKAEPGSELIAESSQVLTKIFAHMRETGARTSDLALLVPIHEDQLRSMVFGLAPVAVPGEGHSSARAQGHLRAV